MRDENTLIDSGYGYGYCPECHAPGIKRERKPDGNDMCVNWHVYPSTTALKESK